MAGRREYRCVGPSYPLADRKASAQRLVNMYLERVEAEGETQFFLRDTPGLRYTTEFNPFRGAIDADGRVFVVYGSTLEEIDISRVLYFQVRGSLATASGFVSMKRGRDQIVFSDGPNGYVFNLTTNTLSTITDPDWRGTVWVEEMDGYFIFVPPNSDQFYWSAIDDGSNLDALDFSSADVKYDLIVTHRVLKRQLLLFGERTTEIWINSGDLDSPFVRYGGSAIEIGCVGVRAAINTTDSVVWVGQTGRGGPRVYMMDGSQPRRISTTAVEERLLESTDITQTWMWTDERPGHEFVAVSTPGMETTWVFDMSTQQWHERARFVNGQWAAADIQASLYTRGENVAFTSDRFFYYEDSYKQNQDEPLVRERTWPHLVAPDMEPVNYRSLELLCTTGETDAGSVTLEVSNDGGYTFGAVLSRTLGATGRRMQRVRWNFLGSARDRVFRIRYAGTAPFNIHGATVDDA